MVSICIGHQEGRGGEPEVVGINSHGSVWEDLFSVGRMEGSLSEDEGGRDGEG